MVSAGVPHLRSVHCRAWGSGSRNDDNDLPLAQGQPLGEYACFVRLTHRSEEGKQSALEEPPPLAEKAAVAAKVKHGRVIPAGSSLSRKRASFHREFRLFLQTTTSSLIGEMP